MTIGSLLRDRARDQPEVVAIVDERSQRTLTFAELERSVAHAASWWRAQGLRRGQAVLIFVPMSADLYIALLALFRLGAVALFLDPSAGREHLERCCTRWAPDAFLGISKAHWLRLRSAALRRIPLKVSVGWWIPGTKRWRTFESAKYSPDHTPDETEPGDAALVTFTSGSTGVPKATVRTHGFLLAQYRALAPNIALHAGEVDLATLPVFALGNLAAGLTTVIPSVDLRRPGAVDGEKLFAQIERSGVTRITAAPAFFECLIACHESTGKTLDRTQKLYTGGAPVFPRLLQALRRLAPHAQVVAVYGSTEAEPIAHIDLEQISADDLALMRAGRGLLAGLPVAEVRVAILEDRWGTPRSPMAPAEFNAAILPSGDVGEIVVAGDHVLKSYLGGIGDQESKFAVGSEIWHRTGDAGYFDAQGRLWLQGRCSARIDDAHGRLYPFGVECVAMTFPAVRRAAALTQGGERILVIESQRDAILEAELVAANRWAHLSRVVFMERLPVDRRHNAKIDYPALRDLLESPT